jgi:hypothetical protein
MSTRCHGNKGQGAVGKKLAGDAAYWDSDIFKRTVMTGIDQNIQAYLKAFGLLIRRSRPRVDFMNPPWNGSPTLTPY